MLCYIDVRFESFGGDYECYVYVEEYKWKVYWN